MTETLPHLPLSEIEARLAQGARLVDIRERDEFAAEHIAGALNLPLSEIGAGTRIEAGAAPVVYLCRSGTRTRRAAGILASLTGDAVALDGGILGWKAAGKPVAED